ncbi:unnamed protein product [Cladocopium goreaui]|nr:unnamed protein product [Cladocopium goreaui]
MKRTPEDVQRNVTVADVWTLEGEHIPSYMVRGGFLSHVEEYQDAMADILSVASAKQKHDQLSEIQETLGAELSELSKLSELKQVDEPKTHSSAPWLALLLILLVFAIMGLAVWRLSRPTPKKTKRKEKGEKAA